MSRIVANSSGNSYKTSEFMKKYEDQRRARLPDFRKKSKKVTSAVKEKSGSEKLNDLMFDKAKFPKTFLNI